VRPTSSIRRECLDEVVVFGEGHLRNLPIRTSNITMSVELACPWTKLRRGRFAVSPFSADYISNIAEFGFPTGTSVQPNQD
jgi:hypothetical protein